MPALISKPLHLIFNRRAVPRTYPLNQSREHRRTVEVSFNHLVRPLIRIGDVTLDLRKERKRTGLMKKRKRHRLLISRLRLKNGKIDTPPMKPRRGPRLETGQPKTQSSQRTAQPLRRR